MDRTVVFYLLLLMGLTWLLYKLTILLEPSSQNPASGPHGVPSDVDSGASSDGERGEQLMHRKLRK